MDPVGLIVDALAAGAAAGASDAAESSVRAAYERLRSLLQRRFAGNKSAERALEEHARNPQLSESLHGYVLESGAAAEDEIKQAAQLLMQLLKPSENAAGKYQVSLEHSQGVNVGDNGVQYNTFNRPARDAE